MNIRKHEVYDCHIGGRKKSRGEGGDRVQKGRLGGLATKKEQKNKKRMMRRVIIIAQVPAFSPTMTRCLEWKRTRVYRTCYGTHHTRPPPFPLSSSQIPEKRRET